MTSRQRVIDSHIHLFANPQLESLAWMTNDNKLYGNHRLDEYQNVINSNYFDPKGCIFIETDVKSGLDEQQWNLPIQEFLFVERIVNNQQLIDEGNADGSNFIKAIIPWAPIPVANELLLEYISKLKSSTQNKSNLNLIKGFRYLLQDKPTGTMISSNFIENLNWLGRNDYIFDLGIDIHTNGLNQLKEFTEVDLKTSNVTYIVNHLCKPSFDYDDLIGFYDLWKSIKANTKNIYYIKLSGAFSELNNDIIESDIDLIINKVLPWVKIFLEIFGEDFIIWGSDWPVSTLKFNNENSWLKWAVISEKICIKLNINTDKVFYKNSIEAYHL